MNRRVLASRLIRRVGMLRFRFGWRSIFEETASNRLKQPNRRGVAVTTPLATSEPHRPEPSFLDSLPASGPPQKRRTWLIVLVIILAFVLTGILGWVALIGSAGKAINDGITEASAEKNAVMLRGEGLHTAG